MTKNREALFKDDFSEFFGSSPGECMDILFEFILKNTVFQNLFPDINKIDFFEKVIEKHDEMKEPLLLASAHLSNIVESLISQIKTNDDPKAIYLREFYESLFT